MTCGGLRVVRLAAACLLAASCASKPAPPTHFGPWGLSYPLGETDRAVLTAAVVAATTGETGRVVLARYAGGVDRRIDLASLDHQVPVPVDAGGRLGTIDWGPAQYRTRVFDYYFPGRTTILELSVPDVRGASATVTASRWDALAWKCDLPGKSERLRFRLEGQHWILAAAPDDSRALRLPTSCP